LVEEGGGGHGRLLVLGLRHIPGSIREMMGEASIPCHIGTVPDVQPMQLSHQVLQLPILVLVWAVFEPNSFGFDFLHRAAQCFVFRVEVIGGSGIVVVLLLGAFIVRGVVVLLALGSAAAAVGCPGVVLMGFWWWQRIASSCGGSWCSDARFVIVVRENNPRGL